MKTVKRVGGRAVEASVSVRLMAGLVLVASVVPAGSAWGQSTYMWKTTTTGTGWLNSANWTAGPANTAPGVSANGSSLIDGNAGDVAVFNALGFPGAEIGIDFSASANTGVGNDTGANGLLTLGAINWNSPTTAVTIGKSDSVAPSGILRLTGAIVTSGFQTIPNVLISVSSGAGTDLTIADTVFTGTGTLAVQLGTANGGFHVATDRSLTIGSAVTELSAGSGFTKLGGGTLTLSGTNTFTGPVTVQAGVLSARSAGAFGAAGGTSSVASGGAVSLEDGVVISGESISLRGTGAANGAGTGNGALRAAENATAFWAGTIILDDAVARLGAADGGTLRVSGSIQNGLANTLNIGAGFPGGSGTVLLSGTNTYTGNTNIIRGTLKLGRSNALPTGTVLDVDSSNAAETAIFDLAGFNQTVGGLKRSVPAGGGGSLVKITGNTPSTLTVNQAINTEFSGAILGRLSLTKSGAGQLALTGANAFTGNTVVSRGILAVDPSALAATAAINVTSGGTLLLTGDGERINDGANLTLGGGRLSMEGISDQTENLGALILSASSIVDFGSGSGNTLAFRSLNLGANTLSIYNWSGAHYFNTASDPGTPALQDRLLFANDTGLVGVSPQLLFFSDAGTTLIGNGKQVLFGSPVSAVEIVPIPEPGSVLTGVCLLGLIGWRERRRSGRLLRTDV